MGGVIIPRVGSALRSWTRGYTNRPHCGRSRSPKHAVILRDYGVCSRDGLEAVSPTFDAACLALKKVDSQKVNKMIKFQSLPRQKRQAIREEVLRMYAETDMSYVEIAEVNGVQLRTVEYIIRNFASELPETPVMRKNKKDASAEDYDALRAEITRLKKELRHEKMRAEALDTMIDVAEEMFNIPVRKKAGTKQ